MFILLGEKNIQLCGTINQTTSYDDFFSSTNHKKYKYILDKKVINFSAEQLKHCSLIEAHKILRCTQRILSPYEDVSLITQEECGFWGKHNFYIQKNIFKDKELFEKINPVDGVILMENIISEFCKNITEINADTWWMYVAHHVSSGLRIVAGIGNVIILSRFLELDNIYQDEIARTIVYLKRFGLKNKQVKIITTLNNIPESIQINLSEICEKLGKNKCETIEMILISFLKSRRNFKKAFVSKNNILKFIFSRSFRLMLFIALLLISFFITVAHKNISNEINEINKLKRHNNMTSNCICLNITDENFAILKQFMEIFKQSQNPISDFQKLGAFCKKNKIKINQLNFEYGKPIKIRTKLYKHEIEKIKKISDQQLTIQMQKIANDDYEEIGLNKRNEVIICIQIK